MSTDYVTTAVDGMEHLCREHIPSGHQICETCHNDWPCIYAVEEREREIESLRADLVRYKRKSGYGQKAASDDIDLCLYCETPLPGFGGAFRRARAAGWKRRWTGDGSRFICPPCAARYGRGGSEGTA